jgi:hypothetical protein
MICSNIIIDGLLFKSEEKYQCKITVIGNKYYKEITEKETSNLNYETATKLCISKINEKWIQNFGGEYRIFECLYEKCTDLLDSEKNYGNSNYIAIRGEVKLPKSIDFYK